MSRNNIVTLQQPGFDEFVKSSTIPVLVDFWAEWCGPCKAMEPVLEELAAEYEGRLVIAKVNVDSEPDLAARFGIMAIPTMVLLSEGEEVERIRGALPRHALSDRLAKHLSTGPSPEPRT